MLYSAVDISVLLFSICVLFILYWCVQRLNYFKDRNVPYLRSFPFIGALSDVIFGKKGLYDCTDDIYNDPKFTNEPFMGIFIFHKPALLIKDLEIIKQIFVKDFNSFMNHHAASDDHDPVGCNTLFMSKDNMWRNIRKKLTPFFTSGKMKLMFPVLDKVSDELVAYIERQSSAADSSGILVKDTLSLFTTDVIANVAFGVDANSFKDFNSEFARIGRKMFGFTFRRGLEFTSIFLLPEIIKFVNFKLFTEEGTDFIRKSITHVMAEREKSKVHRNDLIDLLIEIKNSELRDNDDQPLSMDTLFAQAAGFFSAGHETSSGTAAFSLYELAMHQDIQKRVRAEIQSALKNTDGKLTYDIVMNETPYTHQVLLEVLRIFPVFPFIDRECTNPNGYSLKPYSDFVIPYKMPIIIPVYGIQRDEKYFPNPSKFDPERFSPENIHKVSTFASIPFGIGNRSCIGERLGLLQSKTAIIKILMNYRVDVTETTPREIKLAKNAIVIQSEVPLVLKFVKDEMKI